MAKCHRLHLPQIPSVIAPGVFDEDEDSGEEMFGIVPPTDEYESEVTMLLGHDIGRQRVDLAIMASF